MVSEMVKLQHGEEAATPQAELLTEYLFSLQQSFEEVFDVDIVDEAAAQNIHDALQPAAAP